MINVRIYFTKKVVNTIKMGKKNFDPQSYKFNSFKFNVCNFTFR